MNIRLYLLTHGRPYLIDGDNHKWNEDFMDKLIDGEDFLRANLILPLNERIGVNKWKLIFIESGLETHDFDVKVYCQSELEAITILETINSIMPDYKFKFLCNI